MTLSIEGEMRLNPPTKRIDADAGMGELASQHAAWSGARMRLGFERPVARVRRPLPDIERPQPIYERREPRRPLLTPPVKAHGPAGGEQWPPQPKPVFYDDAAPPPVATWQSIVHDACLDHDVTEEELVGERQLKHIVRARDDAAFRMVTELRMSYTSIGRRLGGRDHTTIIASLARYVGRTPGAAAKFNAARAAVQRDRAALKEQAVHLYLHEGKSVSQIVDLLPLSDQSIRKALKKWGAWL